MAQQTRTYHSPKNPANEESTLFKKLTRLFSGPIVNWNAISYKNLRRRQLDKYKIKDAHGKSFKKSSYSPIETLAAQNFSNQGRASRYADFEQMEFNSALSTAMDIIAGEMCTATHLSPILRIDCKNEEIKITLNSLFYDILNVEHNMFGWCRNMIKYGDSFAYLDIDEELGIKNMIGLPTHEMERLEGEDKSNPNYVRFRWNQGAIVFENWQVAHFRILGNEKYAPYGMCLRADTRILTDDGVKEIKDLQIGDKVVSFDIKTQKKVVAEVKDKVCSGKKQCYEIRTKHNYVEASTEHKIMVYDKEKDEFSYKNVLDIRIGDLLVTSKGIGGNKEIEIVLPDHPSDYGEKNNNGWYQEEYKKRFSKHVDEKFAQLFGFLIGDGWIKDNHTVCMARGVDEEINSFYEQLLQEYSGKAILRTKRMIKNELQYHQSYVGSKYLVNVLRNMGFEGRSYEKRIPSWVFAAKREIQEAFIQGLVDSDGSVFVDKWNCVRYQIELANEQLTKDIKILLDIMGYKSGKISSRMRTGTNQMISKNVIKTRRRSYILYWFASEKCQAKINDCKNRLSDDFVLEPVISINQTTEEDVYDIDVADNNHNFFANGIVVHNSALDGARRPWRMYELMLNAMMSYRIVRAPTRRVFYIDVGGIAPGDVEQHLKHVISSMKEGQVIDPNTGRVDLRYDPFSTETDYYIPVRGTTSGTRIDTLAGGEFTGDVEDVKMIRDELLLAIKIPASYLTYGEGGDVEKGGLAQKDIVFARTIQRFQRAIVSELEKIALIHLYILGFRGKDLLSFKLSLNNPSKIAEMQELEHWKEKFGVAAAAAEGFFSKRWIAEKLFDISEKELKQIERELYRDRKISAELEALGTPPEPGMGGGGDMGDMGDMPEEPAEEEQPETSLLAAPEAAQIAAEAPTEAAKRADSSDKTKRDTHTTPRAKGKMYTPVKFDSRPAGAKLRHIKGLWSNELGSSTERNIMGAGYQSLKSFARGIAENDTNYDVEERLILESDNSARQLLKELDGGINSNDSSQQEKK